MAARRVAVAASGGRDSTALLHCTARMAAALGVEVVALHVHHGLMPDADAWLAQVRAQARRWGAGFAATRLSTRPAAGDSIEAWARRERYRALGDMARAAGCDLVLLAHHRQDQAETFLLQALRGGGPAGLASMPANATRQDLHWARPWLDMPRAAVEAYVQRHRLRHAEDASNADPRYARSRLRRDLWPALQAAFPDAEPALAQAARRAQEAAALAAEAAALDLPPLQQGSELLLAPWLALPPARRRNALRAWLAQSSAAPVPESLVQRLTLELHGNGGRRWPWPGGELRLYRGRLALQQAAPAAPADVQQVNLSQPGLHAAPGWQGVFSIEPASARGAPAALLHNLQLRPRSGGERFCLAPGGTPRGLKKQFQARGVPAWERGGPLLFAPEGRLVFVPGLGLDARVQAEAGTPRLDIRWLPATTGPGQPGR
jgi:tRNA(Ile)-lysidine synthase